ncbi:hypothetical protein I2I11_07945 [Pontibacter sp. 172403-2]|uniref:hypothetical protein n=1 Tax=Pontibacter rufus TaxID=2791028 RepID=UPI0018AFFAA4|nr:hypothetical protein [Pontibacter sp. 172403-2]MBF9253219.1 hypothetical protein [Pontibacter sp. 172403-2]
MVEIAALASGTVATLVPYLIQGGKGFAGEAGKNLFIWLKDKFASQNKQKDLEDLQAKPNDTRLQGRLEVVLENILAENRKLVPELAKLVKDAKGEVHSVNNSKNVNTGTIKDINGHVTFGDNNTIS